MGFFEDEARRSDSANNTFAIAKGLSTGEATVATQEKINQALNDERVYVADSGLITLNDNGRFLLENNSTNSLIIFKAVSYKDGDYLAPDIIFNPEVNLPTTDRNTTNLANWQDDPDVNFYVDEGNPMEAGTSEDSFNTGTAMSLPGGFNTRDYIAVVPSGNSLGITTDQSSTLFDSTDVKTALFYYHKQ